MKRKLLNAVALLAIFGMVFTSCKKDEIQKKEEKKEQTAEGATTLPKEVTGVVTLDDKVDYRLRGALVVKSGATLNIPAGTTIKAEKGGGNYILVERGAKININGTKDKPVTMTADTENAKAGHWGGLVINGYAPLAGGLKGSTEISTEQEYGGDKADDNSGSITYLKLIATGNRLDRDVEHNALTLNGVGNGTKIENVFVENCADDGIEFFGGTVNVKNLLVVNTDDDMFDVTQGWSGTLENAYGVWEKGYSSTEKDPSGVEADGNLDGEFPTQEGQSDFTIKNLTIDLKLDYNTDKGTTMLYAFNIRRGAKANIQNALVKGSGRVETLVNFKDKKGKGNSESIVNVTNKLTTAPSETTSGKGNVTISDDNTGCDTVNFSWTGYKF